MIQFRQSIGFRLLIVSFILLSLPLLVDSFILIQKRNQHSIRKAKETLVEAAHLRAIPLSRLQPLDKAVVELLASYLHLDSHFPSEPDAALDAKLQKLAQIGQFYGMTLLKITEEGKYLVIAASRQDIVGKDYTDLFKLTEIYAPNVLEKGYATFFLIDKNTLRPFFMLTNPIFSFKEGKNVGMIVLYDDVSSKLELLLKPDKQNYQINFAFLLPSTIVYATSEPEFRFQYFMPLSPHYRELFIEEEPNAAKMLPNKPLSINTTLGFPFIEFKWKGEQQMGYIMHLQNSKYSFLAYASKNKIIQAPLIEFFHDYIAYGLILVIGGALSFLLTKRMAKPMQQLGSVMHHMQKGSIHLRYQKDPFGFEINSLGSIFNGMVEAILHQKHAAEEERINRETFASELRLGRQVQQSLLPEKMPFYHGVELAKIYIPMIEVGGDFFDVFIKQEKEDTKIVIAIADVSGKGVQACFYSLGVRNMLRTFIKEYADIAQAMHATNDLFRLDTGDTGMFVTVLCGVYDHHSKQLNYFSCGHNPGLILRENETIEILENKGIAMGVFSSDQSSSSTLQLKKGDVVVFYTDGITEAHNKQRQLFGEDRLIECLKGQRCQSATEIVSHIVKQVNLFVDTAQQHDDITLLVMKIKE